MRNHIANICHDCRPLFNHFSLVIPQHLTLQQQQQKKKSFQQGQNSNLRLARLAISAKSRKLPLQQRLCGPAQEPAAAEMSLPCRTP